MEIPYNPDKCYEMSAGINKITAINKFPICNNRTAPIKVHTVIV